MSQQSEYEPTQKDSALSQRIINRADRKFEKGLNLFTARGLMGTLAIFMVENSSARQHIIDESNAGIIHLLTEKNAEGEVYAVRQDLGNGDQDTTDFVRITARDGVQTGAVRTDDVKKIVIRARTEISEQ